MITTAALARLMMLTFTYGPVKINSGFRTTEHNKRVGGVKNSRHLYGKAFDLSTKNLSRTQKAKLIRKSKELFDVVIVYSSHIHVHIK